MRVVDREPGGGGLVGVPVFSISGACFRRAMLLLLQEMAYWVEMDKIRHFAAN